MGCIYGSAIDRERCKFCSAYCSVRPTDVVIASSTGTTYKE